MGWLARWRSATECRLLAIFRGFERDQPLSDGSGCWNCPTRFCTVLKGLVGRHLPRLRTRSSPLVGVDVQGLGELNPGFRIMLESVISVQNRQLTPAVARPGDRMSIKPLLLQIFFRFFSAAITGSCGTSAGGVDGEAEGDGGVSTTRPEAKERFRRGTELGHPPSRRLASTRSCRIKIAHHYIHQKNAAL